MAIIAGHVDPKKKPIRCNDDTKAEAPSNDVLPRRSRQDFAPLVVVVEEEGLGSKLGTPASQREVLNCGAKEISMPRKVGDKIGLQSSHDRATDHF